ncbi:MAG: GntR family transcriptional regulator [Christensenellales bacterium]
MLERNNPIPLYIQLEELLRTSIQQGEWPPDSMIPSENEMSRIYGVSRMTVRSVITALVKEGLLYRVQGKGTFVAENKISTRPLAYMGIREQLEEMGYETSTKLTNFSTMPAPDKVADTLGIARGDEVYYIERLRYIKKTPLSIHRTYLPAAYCPGFTGEMLESEQLCVLLENKYGLTMDKVKETLESTASTQEEEKLLNLPSKSPLLKLEDLIFDRSGKAYEYSIVLFRGNKIKLHFEYDVEQSVKSC